MVPGGCRVFRRSIDTFESFPRTFWVIALGVLVSSAGSSMIWPFQLIYIGRQLGLQTSTVGMMVTISSGIGLAVSFLGGSLADHAGRKPVMLAAQAAHGLAYLLMAAASSYFGFLAALTLIYIAMPIYSIGSDSMMADMLPAERRTEGYSILRMTSNAGIAIGPAIGGIIVSTSYTAAFHGAAVLMALQCAMLLGFVRETLDKAGRDRGGARRPEKRKEALEGYARVLKDRFFVLFMLVVAIGLVGPMMMWILLALYTKQAFGMSERLFSWIPITNALMCVFVQYFVTRLTLRFKPLTAIAAGMLVYAVGVGSVAWMGGFPGFIASMVILSLGELILTPTSTAFVASRAPVDLRGRYMSIYWVTWGIARAVAPMVGGILNDRISPRATWHGGLLIGAASAIGLAVMARWHAARELPEAEKAPCAV